MSAKEEIYEAISSLGLTVAYRDADLADLPRVSFLLSYNNDLRLSNKVHTKRPVYEVDYFTREPQDVEDSEVLKSITKVLEEKYFLVTAWEEDTSFENEMTTGIYRYYAEVK